MSLADHLQTPDVTIEAHIAARAAALAASLEDRVPIYLDTRFWIMVREVRDGTSTRADEREIVRLIEQLIDCGIAFCPISEPTFSEIMKQGKIEQREATARAIDELSCGVTLRPDHERMVTEAESLLIGRMTTGQSPPLPSAWTSLAFVLGNTYPAETAFPAGQERAIQKAFYDHLWDRPLVEIALAIDSDDYTREAELQESARWLTAQNALHRPAMKSFDQVLEQEFHGVAQTIVERAPQLAAAFGSSAAGMAVKPATIFTNAIREMFKNPDYARLMPTAHVHAVIHSIFRWEYRDKPFTANDLVDFRHAAAALGYCALMLTEDGLRKTLCHRRMALAELHRRDVVSDRSEAISRLGRVSARKVLT